MGDDVYVGRLMSVTVWQRGRTEYVGAAVVGELTETEIITDLGGRFHRRTRVMVGDPTCALAPYSPTGGL